MQKAHMRPGVTHFLYTGLAVLRRLKNRRRAQRFFSIRFCAASSRICCGAGTRIGHFVEAQYLAGTNGVDCQKVAQDV